MENIRCRCGEHLAATLQKRLLAANHIAQRFLPGTGFSAANRRVYDIDASSFSDGSKPLHRLRENGTVDRDDGFRPSALKHAALPCHHVFYLSVVHDRDGDDARRFGCFLRRPGRLSAEAGQFPNRLFARIINLEAKSSTQNVDGHRLTHTSEADKSYLNASWVHSRHSLAWRVRIIVVCRGIVQLSDSLRLTPTLHK